MLQASITSLTSMTAVRSSAGVSLGGVADRLGDPGGGWSVLAAAVLAAVIAVMVVRAGDVQD